MQHTCWKCSCHRLGQNGSAHSQVLFLCVWLSNIHIVTHWTINWQKNLQWVYFLCHLLRPMLLHRLGSPFTNPPPAQTLETRSYLQRLYLLRQNLMRVVHHRRGWSFVADVLDPLLCLNGLVQVQVRIFVDSATNHCPGTQIVAVTGWGQALWRGRRKHR